MSEYELRLTASGPMRVVTTTETEGMTIEQSELREVTADIDLDADRLYNSDIATTHSNGVVIPLSDVACVVCTELGGTLANRGEWDITVSGSLDDWQKVALLAAKEKKNGESSRAKLGINILLQLHDRADSDRPLYAALNVDETYDVGARDKILDQLVDGDDAAAATDTEVPADV
ncbi:MULTISPECIES: hypothetical protein [Haloferacaceae]|uniref:Uncharacterized protein n=1 Tax=Halorubrum glutamatedens TaxID=2707018 RepID=A0ABD5QTE9_9EURY|nr:hypothetical protein [Halobellus captivus]